MERIGEMRPGEGGWPFFYKRCGVCGYTVREFLGFEELGQLLPEETPWAQEESEWARLALLVKEVFAK
jgi:hypothetical protein